MNAYYIANRQPTSAAARQYVPAKSPSRPPHRERDFGIGYGTSSGYATTRRYSPSPSPRLFRFV